MLFLMKGIYSKDGKASLKACFAVFAIYARKYLTLLYSLSLRLATWFSIL